MENKGERLAVSVSPEMLRAIDDYRFESREGSRSEIIRQLIEIGLATVGHAIEAGQAPPEPAQPTKTRKAK